jgi:hypothetical protein
LTAPADPLQSYSTNEENRQSNHEPSFTEVKSDFADDSEYFAPEADAPNTNEPSTNNCSIDQSSLKWYNHHIVHKQGTLATPTTYKPDVELLHLLQKSNAPMSLYGDVQKWARKSFAINQDVFSRAHMSRKKVLQLVEKKFDAAGWYPQSSTLVLPYANRRITIQTYDFSQAVYSLLTDPVLMREENLDLARFGNREDNPLYPFPKPAMAVL